MKNARDNVELVCSVAELGSLFTGTRSLDEFLHKVVTTIAGHMHVPVCSIYLHDDRQQLLILKATHGLKQDAPGRVRMKLGEGITGTALKEMRAIREDKASANRNFKFFPDTDEEQYEAFLAVPIIRGLNRIGALVVQHRLQGYFDEEDTKTLRAISSQLAGAIENTKLFLDLSAPAGETTEEIFSELFPGTSTFIRGTSGSQGFAIGKVSFYGMLSRREHLLATEENGDCPLTLADFDRAVQATAGELESLQTGLEQEALDLQASLIFNAHLLMLKDPAFYERIRRLIKEGQAPCSAVIDTVNEFVTAFRNSPNPRLQEKVQDVNDLGHRLLSHLRPDETDRHDYRNRIVIAGEILPSDILKIATQKAAGLIITAGTFTAHVTILARSLAIPLVVADDNRLFQLNADTEIIIDASQGTIYINPDQTVRTHYRQLTKASEKAKKRTGRVPGETSLHTADGTRIHVLANLNLISETSLAMEFGAEGIGLYRSEFPYLIRNDFPAEEEQFRIYRKILQNMQGRPVTFRTLDVGGDKMLSYFPSAKEANPFLGLRSIRFSFRHQEIFQQQLRALLRAGADSGHNLRIMFPMVSSVDDFLKIKDITAACSRQLAQEKIAHNPEPRLGIMIELPAAVEIARELAVTADFICLGTNDLIQYMLAADRTNPDIAGYYLPWHPAVLRALQRVASAVREEKKPLTVCGEIVNDAGLLNFLIGLGIRDFSIDPHGIAGFRHSVHRISTAGAEVLARELLKLGTIEEIKHRRKFIRTTP